MHIYGAEDWLYALRRVIPPDNIVLFHEHKYNDKKCRGGISRAITYVLVPHSYGTFERPEQFALLAFTQRNRPIVAYYHINCNNVATQELRKELDNIPVSH